MKAQYRYMLLPLIALSMAACEKEIKVTIPEEASKLVINSNTTTGNILQVHVGKSNSILKYRHNNNDLGVGNAQVILFSNNMAIDTLQYTDSAGFYESDIAMETGKEYKLVVSAPGMSSVDAKSIVPSVVPITFMQRSFKTRVDENGMEQDEVRIEFNDPATPNDYYIIKFVTGPNTTGMYYCVNANDASVESVYNEEISSNTCLSLDGIFIRDNLFNGSKKELKFYVNSLALVPDSTTTPGNILYPSIQLLHVTEEYFKYRKSHQSAIENFNNPFAEPVNVYTNVNNGYGIFSVNSVDEKQIK